MHLFLKVPPQEEPVPLEELKVYLRISSHQEDLLLKKLLSSARAYVEKITGRALLKQQWQWILKPPFPPHSPLVKFRDKRLEIDLPRPPLLEVESVHSRGKRVSFFIENQKVILSPRMWDQEISILYWAGYGENPESLPPDLKAAILMVTSFLYDNQKGPLPFLNAYKVTVYTKEVQDEKNNPTRSPRRRNTSVPSPRGGWRGRVAHHLAKRTTPLGFYLPSFLNPRLP